MKKITAKTFKKICVAYRISGFVAILLLLAVYAFAIGKLAEFLLILIPYFFTKGFYPLQWHSKSLKQCFFLSLLIFSFLTTIALPKEYSLTVSAMLGLLSAYASYKFAVIRLKLEDYAYIEPLYTEMITQKFDVENCTEKELLERCRSKGFSIPNTLLAVEFFIYKTPHKIIAENLCIDEQSVTRRKLRLKEKLNK